MSFGFKAVNDSGFVQIDSDSPRLCAVEKGSYGNGTDAPSVIFSQPITTIDPPMIFIRPTVSGSGKQIIYESVLLGVPGNWTGFKLRAANVTWRPTGTWFCAVFATRTTADYGMRIWSAASDLAYDSGAAPVIVTGVYSNWTYDGEEALTIGSRWRWVIPRILAADEYLLLNGFTLNLLSPSTLGTISGIHVDYANSRIVLYGTDFTVWTNVGHKPMLFARLSY